jgi:hypothetical protein
MALPPRRRARWPRFRRGAGAADRAGLEKQEVAKSPGKSGEFAFPGWSTCHCLHPSAVVNGCRTGRCAAVLTTPGAASRYFFVPRAIDLAPPAARARTSATPHPARAGQRHDVPPLRHGGPAAVHGDGWFGNSARSASCPCVIPAAWRTAHRPGWRGARRRHTGRVTWRARLSQASVRRVRCSRGWGDRSGFGKARATYRVSERTGLDRVGNGEGGEQG